MQILFCLDKKKKKKNLKAAQSMKENWYNL